MKIIKILPLAVLCGILSASSNAASIPPAVVSALGKAEVSDSGSVTPSSEAETIGDYMKLHWSDVINDDIVKIPQHQRYVMYASCSDLGPQQYLEFLKRGRKLSEAHVINDDEYIFLQTPSNKKQAFTTINLHNAEVRDLYLYNEKILLRAGYPTEKLENLDEEKLIRDTRAQISSSLLSSIELPKNAPARNSPAGGGNPGENGLAPDDHAGSNAFAAFFEQPRNWVFSIAIIGLIAATVFLLKNRKHTV